MAERDVFVAKLDGQIVGTVSLGGGKLHSMFVEPSHQGKGIGIKLVEHLEAHAANVRLVTLWLSSSVTARPFYEKLNYQLHEREERSFGSTFAMSKVIKR